MWVIGKTANVMKVWPHSLARLLLALCLLVAGGIAIWSARAATVSAPVEANKDFRDIQLVDQFGKRFTLSEYDDQPVLVNFVFTGCSTYCPVQTGALLTSSDELSADHPDQSFKFVSISLTPLFDRPRDMKSYSERFSVVREDWIFATGDAENIETILAQLKLKVEYGERPNLDVFHETDIFVLQPGKAGSLRFEGIPLDHQGLAGALFPSAVG